MSETNGRYPDLAGRVAVVTGGSRGIGAGIARALAWQGVAVAVAARDGKALDQVVGELREAGGTAHGVIADVTDPDAIHALRRETEERLGPVDLVAAVAGGQGAPARITELAPETWHATVDVNLTSVFLTLREFLPGMVERRRGAVVTMSSTAGRMNTPASPAYGAAKAGLLMLTHQAAAQVADSGVRINAIAPATVRTERLARIPESVQAEIVRAHPLGRMGTPEDVAEAALFLLSDSASWMTGATLDLTGGRTA
jgi:3-oxoacyl-[acyl-carrier protein] reductase